MLVHVHVRDLEQIILDRIEYQSELSGQYHSANFFHRDSIRQSSAANRIKSTTVQLLFNTYTIMDQWYGRFFSCNQHRKTKKTRRERVNVRFILTFPLQTPRLIITAQWTLCAQALNSQTRCDYSSAHTYIIAKVAVTRSCAVSLELWGIRVTANHFDASPSHSA